MYIRLNTIYLFSMRSTVVFQIPIHPPCIGSSFDVRLQLFGSSFSLNIECIVSLYLCLLYRTKFKYPAQEINR